VDVEPSFSVRYAVVKKPKLLKRLEVDEGGVALAARRPGVTARRAR
jgi:hypothetical protein